MSRRKLTVNVFRRQLAGHQGWLRSYVTLGDMHAEGRMVLQDIALQGIFETGISLDGAMLSRSDFNGCEIVSSQMTGMNVHGCSFRNSSFKNCNFRKTDWSCYQFRGCVFDRCLLLKSDFFQTTFHGTQFVDCVMDGEAVPDQSALFGITNG